MSGLKTFVSAVFFASVLGPDAQADMADLATTMAGCAGRFSAELEHAWLMQDDRSEALEAQRESFVTILEAIMPVGSGREILAHRIDAKLAQARLLTIADFGADPTRTRWARQQSRYYKDRCASFLLDS